MPVEPGSSASALTCSATEAEAEAPRSSACHTGHGDPGAPCSGTRHSVRSGVALAKSCPALNRAWPVLPARGGP